MNRYRLNEYDYQLPELAIAQQAVEPRDSALLLDTRTDTDYRISDLVRLLDPGDLVVINHTRVRQARLLGYKEETGARVEALLLKRIDVERWEALLRPARRVQVGTSLRFGDLSATVLTEPSAGSVHLQIPSDPNPEELIEQIGSTPLPPYIKQWSGEPDRYQTVYATSLGSAAAPTAGLHLTTQILRRWEQSGIEVVSVDLSVGWDTFRLITEELYSAHRMHGERFSLSAEVAAAVDRTRRRSGRVVAVGTTVVRVLETMSTATGGKVVPGTGETRIFLQPDSEFRVVDLLVTNFHIPRSSLLLLLAGFMGEGWRAKYELALQRGYRFLSFGDAMLAQRRDR